MTESVYLASPDVNQYRELVLQDEADGIKLVDLMQNATRKETWTPIRVRTFDEKGGAKKPIADISGLSSLTVLSQRAYDSLRGDLPSCEYFPFVCGKNRVWALKTFYQVDCLDETKSQLSRFSDGRIWDIKRYAFMSMPPADAYFFHVPQLPTGELLATERAKKLFDAYGLIGMKFKAL